MPKILALLTIAVALSVPGIPSVAQGQDDAVYKFRAGGGNSKISGEITGMTPLGVTVETRSGTKEIPAAEINKIVFAGQPPEIARARDRIESGRFDDALTELEKISDPVQGPFLKQEVDFLTAFASAQIALRTGNITAQEAGRRIGGFVANNPESCHLFPAKELLGKLLFAVGRAELAEKEFAQMTESNWPEYVLSGYFYQGDCLNELGKYGEAEAVFDAILAMDANDDLTQSFKLLAKCQKAKSQALAGNTDQAINTINEIIKVESPDNTKLFAYAYNALGVAHLKAGNLKAAASAFLHTELLFATEAEPHAEALYQLALIWPQLQQTDRASRAREGLKSRYRNSYWAGKL